MAEQVVVKEQVVGEEKRRSPLKAIRAKCLECSGTWHEVKLCTLTQCALYPFRFGKNPYRTKREYTEEELKQIRARLAAARAKQVGHPSDISDEMDDIEDDFEEDDC